MADEDLMELVRDADARAFEVVFDRHGGAAFSLAYRMCGSRARAEDIEPTASTDFNQSTNNEQPIFWKYLACKPGSDYQQLFVNGTRIVDGGQFTGATPGTLLASARDTETAPLS